MKVEKINERLSQQKMEKENNRVILVNDDESDKKGIGIITSSTRTIESIKKIKKTYIKYGGRASIIDDSGKNVIVEFIEFNSMPIDILKSITEEISEKIKDENISIEEMLEFIFDLFSTHRLERDYEKKLIGDLGEAIFMIEAKNNGINADQMIRKEDNSCMSRKGMYRTVLTTVSIYICICRAGMSAVRILHRISKPSM